MRPTIREKKKATWTTVALCAGLFLAVFGAKLVVIDRYGSDMPNWDQWDAEAEMVLLPYFQGRLSFGDLFRPHNEHRVVLTKALSLGVVLLNGQWDARLQCVVNAALHSLIAVVIFLFLSTELREIAQISLLVLLAILFGAPIAWTNVLSAFHSQQYFLVGLSLAAIALLSDAQAWSARWFAGIVCLFLALFSMASGLLAAVAVLAMLVVADGPASLWRKHLGTLLACVVATGTGWIFRVTVPYHESLRMHSFGDFFWTVWHNLQWPVQGITLFGALSFVPWALLGWRVWRCRGSNSSVEATIFGAGVWVLLQFIATGYARGAGGGWPANRYLDDAAIGLLVNGVAIAVLLQYAPQRHWAGTVRLAAFAIWTTLVVHGVATHLINVFKQDLPPTKNHYVKAEHAMRAYLATDDDRFLDDPDIPYPGKGTLLERLAHPEIRAILPASIRAPLKISGESSPPDAFVVPPRDYVFAQPWTTWRSGSPQEPARQGTWRSEQLPQSAFPYWVFDVTGNPGSAGVSLEIDAPNSGRVIAQIVPRRDARNAWRPAFVRAPRGDAVLIARVEAQDRWLGFSAPVEMARLSYLALLLTKQGIVLIAIGGSVIAVAIVRVLSVRQVSR